MALRWRSGVAEVRCGSDNDSNTVRRVTKEGKLRVLVSVGAMVKTVSTWR